MFKNRGSEDALKMLIKGCWKEYNSSSCSLILCILKTNTKKNNKNKNTTFPIASFISLSWRDCFALAGSWLGESLENTLIWVLLRCCFLGWPIFPDLLRILLVLPLSTQSSISQKTFFALAYWDYYCFFDDLGFLWSVNIANTIPRVEGFWSMLKTAVFPLCPGEPRSCTINVKEMRNMNLMTIFTHKNQSYKLFVQSYPTLFDPMNCSLPGSFVHGIHQARILMWIAIPFSKGSSWPKNWAWVSFIVGRFFTVWVTREVL